MIAIATITINPDVSILSIQVLKGKKLGQFISSTVLFYNSDLAVMDPRRVMLILQSVLLWCVKMKQFLVRYDVNPELQRHGQ